MKKNKLKTKVLLDKDFIDHIRQSEIRQSESKIPNVRVAIPTVHIAIEGMPEFSIPVSDAQRLRYELNRLLPFWAPLHSSSATTNWPNEGLGKDITANVPWTAPGGVIESEFGNTPVSSLVRPSYKHKRNS
jgi:hypothetical protein